MNHLCKPLRRCAVLLAMFAAACGGKPGVRGGSCCDVEAAAASLPDTSVHLLTHAFRDHNGDQRHLVDFRGHPVVIAMIYTKCSFACPAIVADTKRFVERCNREDLRVVFVSMDVERDTPEVLAAFARQNALDPARYTLLHGDAAAVRDLAMVLGMRYAQVEGGEFSHSNLLTLLDREGRIAARRRACAGRGRRSGAA